MARYHVAIMHGRDGPSRGLAETLSKLDGLVVLAAANARRAIVEAAADALPAIREALGPDVMVEREVTFRPSGAGPSGS